MAGQRKWSHVVFWEMGAVVKSIFHHPEAADVAALFVQDLTCGGGVSTLPDCRKSFLCHVLEKQRGMPILQQTTINATYIVPVATSSKGNERMTKIKTLRGLSQQQMGSVTE